MGLVKKYILKTGIKYGLTGSIIILLFYTGLIVINKNIFQPALLLLAGMIIILFVLFSIIEYNQIDRAPRFWKNMSVGMICNLIITVFFALMMIMALKFIRPELHREFVDDRVAMMQEYKQTYIEKFSEEHFNLLLEDVQTTTPLALAFDGPLKTSFGGLFFVIFFSLLFYLIKNKSNRL